MFAILYERAFEIIERNRRAYIVLNVLFYGLMIAGMIYAVFNQPLQASMLAEGNRNYMTGNLSLLGHSYSPGHILEILGFFYFSNLLGASFGGISFPSFIIPFAGVLAGASRALQWGLLFSPASPDIRYPMIMHSLELILEGQAYVLAMLGAYVHGRILFWPQSEGLKSRWKAYVEGVRQTGTLYMLIIPVLAIATIYSAIEMGVFSILFP